MSDLNNNFENQNEYQPPVENSYSYSSNFSEQTDNTATKPKKKKRGFLKAIGFILCMAVVSSGSIIGYRYFEKNNPSVSLVEKDDSNSQSAKDDTSDSKAASTKKETSSVDKNTPSLLELAARSDAKSIPMIVEEAMPSVVGIASTFEYASTNDSFGFGGFGGGFGGFDNYDNYGSSQTKEIKSTGTGIVMTADGYIITNAHVVYDTSEYNCGKAVEISVLFSDESEKEAKIIGYDTESDIAVLKVDANNLTPANFGQSEELMVGELVIAIGNPLGFDLFGSVTTGIVSALNREITINEKQMTLIQTDAAINSGNSGGPLLNSSGQVIGINSAKMSSSYMSSASVEGLGFAIPITNAKIIIDDLINYGYVTGKPQIGISGVDIDEINSRYYNIPQGIWVSTIKKGSAAEKAGIKQSDVIIGIEGEPVKSIADLNKIKNKYKAGDTVTITVSRAGEDMDFKVVLQEIKENT